MARSNRGQRTAVGFSTPQGPVQSAAEISASSSQITSGAENQSASAEETLSTMVEIATDDHQVVLVTQARVVRPGLDDPERAFKTRGQLIDG